MVLLGADHGGFLLKENIKRFLSANNIEYRDYGTFDEESCDYPDIAKLVCNNLNLDTDDRALLFCGTGIGISISANKIKGIRAACCTDYFSAKYTRLHNNANVLCLGGRVIGFGLCEELVNVFLNTDFQGGHHQNRIDKIENI